MKILYLECKMGAAGDMLTAALAGLTGTGEFLRRMNALGLPGTVISAQEVTKCGICGLQISVSVNGTEEQSLDAHGSHHHLPAHEHPHHHHPHTSLHDISAQINALELPEAVRRNALAVYELLAEAESRVHGKPVSDIHFHEVGTLDALADIIGFCLLADMLAPEKIIVSPVNTGSGQVHCAHGILPVPAPATAYLLQGIPAYGSGIPAELCTPTGAALLRCFAGSFGEMPVMRTEKIGYGFGKKDLEALNCVRAFLGESDAPAERVAELKCNLDDMTPEDIGFAAERLFAAGALDVFTTPAGMKKNRPGVLLTVLCSPGMQERLVREMFRYTTTGGIRQTLCERFVLERQETLCRTRYGTLRMKTFSGYGVQRSKPEYDDVAALAAENGVSPAGIRYAAEHPDTE